MEDKLKKDRECIKCKRFFECPGKPESVKRCIQIDVRDEYKEGDGNVGGH